MVAAKLLRYYETVIQPTSAENVQCNPVMKNFEFHWNAFEGKKWRDESEVPKINNAFPVIKWTEAFTDHTHRNIG